MPAARREIQIAPVRRAGVVRPAALRVGAGGWAPPRRKITAGPDGNLWFTEGLDNWIGRITPAGVVAEFPVDGNSNGYPTGIAAGSDGNLWVALALRPGIARVSPAGEITEISLPHERWPMDITAGPDDALWYTDGANGSGGVSRISLTGEVRTVATLASFPAGIAAGPDAKIWFSYGDRIGRITP